MKEVYNKIGFHLSEGGKAISEGRRQKAEGRRQKAFLQGIGGWMRALDGAGIPFFVKGVDSMQGLAEAQALAHDSGVPHVVVFRRSSTGSAAGYDFDTPDYSLDPEAAAASHWAAHKAALPPDLDPAVTWVETMNEVRGEVEWGDWLGNFACHVAQLALTDGYKLAAFGFAAGAPEVATWETDGMLRFLALCQEHPGRLAVALHEYSYKLDNVWFMRGEHIGRFEKLFHTCDKFEIKRPTVLISEWGWTHAAVPNPGIALAHIEEVGQLYGQYPEILGAAIWRLDDGRLGNQVRRLIQSLTDFSLRHRFAVEELRITNYELRDEMFSFSVGTAAPARNNARFIKDVTVPDDVPMPAGHSFTKTWRVQNSGNRAWSDGYKLVFVEGTPMTAVHSHSLPAAVPGQQINVSIDLKAPDTPGTHYCDWRFQDGQGNLFGDIIYARILVTPAAPAPAKPSNARFVADVTIPDDSKVEAGKAFTKTWRVQNNGDAPWPAGTRLVFLRGNPMGTANSQAVPAAGSGQQVDISIAQIAPTAPGDYFGDWRLQDDKGEFFGEILYLRIVVPQPLSFSRIKPLSQRDPAWVNARLGDNNSRQTIGVWGCLLTCFTMIANAYGHELTPPELNQRIVRGPGFINNNWTPWDALAKLFSDIIYDGRLETRHHPNIIDRINATLDAGGMLAVQVDNTPNTPYVDEDQHWVLIVGRGGDDYRVNDPLNGQEVSLRGVYGRPGRPLRDAIIAAIFYRSTSTKINYGPVVEPVPDSRPIEEIGPIPTPPARLQIGMNVNPDAPHSNPFQSDEFKGLDWVRFVFKVAAQINPANRHLQAAFAQYDPIIKAYANMGVSSLIILNQETVWGNAPWSGNQDWHAYANALAEAAGKIGAHYAQYGDRVAYQIWNEGDLRNNPASVFVEPDRFAIVLKQVATVLRAAAPKSKIVFGGMASGPDHSIDYWRQCQAALAGELPVDALGIHPYGRWATKAPFDWGQTFGNLGDAFQRYAASFPNVPLWITEMGVAADNHIGPEHYPAIGEYIRDVYKHVGERYVHQVPVLIWFAWSDLMRNAGIVDGSGNRKPHVYEAFRAVRNREI